MSTLISCDDAHHYNVDGEAVPSVSEIIRFLAKELYKDTPQYYMDTAAKRGTEVHKATQSLDELGKVECDSEISPFVKAYVAFRKEIAPEWEKVEWMVCNGTRYAGTVDRYGKINGLNVILDIKTTANITGLHKLVYGAQLNLYRLAVLKEKPVDALWILQLKKDETYKLIEIPKDDSLALACLTMHEAIEKTKRKRRKAND